jgi:N-acetylglucosaminyl-diphospho-decaprenol L-rhamnosyltransferase
VARDLISVIIVNYRSAAFTRACLRSIFENEDRSGLEVIVVDNASFDGCGEMIAAEFPDVRFLQSSANLGFAGANNAGIAQARGQYLLFLNPDTEVHGNAIGRLRDAMALLPDAGVAGARLLNSDATLQTSCVTAFPSIANQIFGAEYLQRRFPSAKMWGTRALLAPGKSPVKVDAVSGACVMAKKEVIEAANGFTTDYFMYAEDVDLCLKANQAGWNVYHVPDAVVTHHGGQSSGTREESNYAAIMIREATYRFLRIHRGGWYAVAFRAATGFCAAARVVLLTVTAPLVMAASHRRSVRNTWGKWARILAWSAGFQPWARQESSTAEAIRAIATTGPR